MKLRKDKLTVDTFIKDKKEELKLRVLAGANGVDNEIKSNYLSCPGLLLTGYKKHFNAEGIQVLGKQEMSFLFQMNDVNLKKSLGLLSSYKIPCIIVCSKIEPPAYLEKLCETKDIPLLETKLKKCDIVHLIFDYVELKTAPYVYKHATLVDVYGIGILFTGKSGIGKSETALDLVARGHRLVADDVIKITRRKSGILMGQGKEPVDFFHSHLEIRGLGLVDLARIFGVHATRMQKRVEVEVHLVKWSEASDYDRTGLEGRITKILGVGIPSKVIPIVLGKNISVISEMVALEHLLKLYGYDTPVMFNKRLLEILKKKGRKTAMLDSDIE